MLERKGEWTMIVVTPEACASCVYMCTCMSVCVRERGGGEREGERVGGRETVEDSASLPSSEAWICSTVQPPKLISIYKRPRE